MLRVQRLGVSCRFLHEEATGWINQLIEHFSNLDNPHCPGKVEHRLIDILGIAVCAVIAGAESWEDIALYGRSKLAWLRQFLALPNGIPSHDTFRRMFMRIDPDSSEVSFIAWVRALTIPATPGKLEMVAIEGVCRGDSPGAPGALQVADRWPLLGNLRAAVQEVLERAPPVPQQAARQTPALLFAAEVAAVATPGALYRAGSATSDRAIDPTDRSGTRPGVQNGAAVVVGGPRPDQAAAIAAERT